MTVLIRWNGEQLELTGDYYKGEPMVMYPTDKAYPGDSPEFYIDKIVWKDINVYNLLCNDTDILDELRGLAIDEIGSFPDDDGDKAYDEWKDKQTESA